MVANLWLKTKWKKNLSQKKDRNLKNESFKTFKNVQVVSIIAIAIAEIKDTENHTMLDIVMINVTIVRKTLWWFGEKNTYLQLRSYTLETYSILDWIKSNQSHLKKSCHFIVFFFRETAIFLRLCIQPSRWSRSTLPAARVKMFRTAGLFREMYAMHVNVKAFTLDLAVPRSARWKYRGFYVFIKMTW